MVRIGPLALVRQDVTGAAACLPSWGRGAEHPCSHKIRPSVPTQGRSGEEIKASPRPFPGLLFLHLIFYPPLAPAFCHHPSPFLLCYPTARLDSWITPRLSEFLSSQGDGLALRAVMPCPKSQKEGSPETGSRRVIGGAEPGGHQLDSRVGDFVVTQLDLHSLGPQDFTESVPAQTRAEFLEDALSRPETASPGASAAVEVSGSSD